MEVRGYKPHEDIAIILMILLWKRPSSNISPFGKGGRGGILGTNAFL
jgi:hypothetical protein